jgi:hypothetical protein
MQWDYESLEANAEWKDETLWVVTGRDSCVRKTIENLQCNLDGCIKVLTWSDKAETAVVDRLEKKYAPLLEQLESKLKDGFSLVEGVGFGRGVRVIARAGGAALCLGVSKSGIGYDLL